MVRLLQQEIDRVKSLDADIAERNHAYKERMANLESRVDHAKLEWERQRAAADRLREQLTKAVSLTKELVANHELMNEWQADHEIHRQANSRGPSPAAHTFIVPALSSSGVRGSAPPIPPLSPAAVNMPALASASASVIVPHVPTGPHGPTGRSGSVGSNDGSSASFAHDDHSTPLSTKVAALEPPTVLHGGAPLGSGTTQFASTPYERLAHFDPETTSP
jgi:hypothetical protein